MKLYQLRYFQAACHLNGVTTASLALHVSQPSVSAAIRELEDEFSLHLLDHQRRNFNLTQDGRLFLEYVDQLLTTVDYYEAKMKSLCSCRHRLNLGIPPMIGSLFLPRLYRDYFSLHPDLAVSVSEGSRRELLGLLDQKKLDLVFLPHHGPLGDGYESLELGQVETVCCLPAGHPLASKAQLQIRDLASWPLVLFTDGFFHTERILSAFRKEGIDPKILLKTRQIATIKEMVTAGQAVGFLFREVAQMEGAMVYVPLAPSITSTISAVWRAFPFHVTEEMQLFLNHLAAQDRWG